MIAYPEHWSIDSRGRMPPPDLMRDGWPPTEPLPLDSLPLDALPADPRQRLHHEMLHGLHVRELVGEEYLRRYFGLRAL
jgi:hypothetical protein